MVDEDPIEPDRVEDWQAYVDDHDLQNLEPRARPDPFLVFGVALGIFILIGMILLRPTGASRAQADDLAALGGQAGHDILQPGELVTHADQLGLIARFSIAPHAVFEPRHLASA